MIGHFENFIGFRACAITSIISGFEHEQLLRKNWTTNMSDDIKKFGFLERLGFLA